MTFRGSEYEVGVLGAEGDTDGVDLALFSAGGGTSSVHAPRFADAGALVVDNSSAWRMDPEVPLVVTEVNADQLERRPPKGIVANPNCTTMTAMLPLHALHEAFGLTGFTATSLQAAGGAGQKGMAELRGQVEPLFAAGDLLRSAGASARDLVPPPEVHADVLAFNVVPRLGTIGDGGYTDEEWKLVRESRKILDLPDLVVSPTCVRVPVMVGHSDPGPRRPRRATDGPRGPAGAGRAAGSGARRRPDPRSPGRAATRWRWVASGSTRSTTGSSTSSSSGTTC